MDSNTYNQIAKFCTKFLAVKFHDRHLEDLIQYVAMKFWESEGKGNWNWYCCDYTRENGLNRNERSKQSARTLELSLSIDAPGKNEESENSIFLLDQESISKSELENNKNHQTDSFKGALEEFLSPLKLSNEVLIWTINHYKVAKKFK